MGRLPMVGLAMTSGVLLGSCHVALQQNSDVCTPGDAVCRNSDVLVRCDDNHVREIINCADFCVANYGPDYVSRGCDSTKPDNPCNCKYDAIDGMIAECYPNERWCAGPDSITWCNTDNNEWGHLETINCSQYCHLTYGPDYYSWEGCDDQNAENPCQCVYDIIDGMFAECLPGEVECAGNGQLAVCTESYYFEYRNCADVCVETRGEGSVSEGCSDDSQDNPCLCTED